MKTEVVHDSMGITGDPITELRGVKVGDVFNDAWKVMRITPAGEAIMRHIRTGESSWDYVDALNGTKPDL